ncbi:GAF and ANTAR domain-containing protein [Cellulomonas sp. 179-A 4D5 NHS]|uniref:GAF and ANTAR domain-containing protein n=1 Tax=Cellulomonas sp. 179-A 4D5 NHS TaxID=3142378 RepID=UPI0039A14BC3
MDRTVERAHAITELHTLLLEAAGVEEFVEGVAQAAAARIRPDAHVAIMLKRQGRPTGVASSDERAAQCDEVEFAANEGPCLTSAETGERIVIQELERGDERWPAWADAARQVGFRSAAAIPRSVREGVDIAINLYSEDPGVWDDDALATAEMYADEVARTLRLCLRSADQAEINEDLKAALASRAVIDQAMGVIMAENRCSSEEAFRILRSASQNRNLKLRDVAASLIENVTGVAPQPGTEFAERKPGT